MALTVGIRADGFFLAGNQPMQRVTLTPGAADYVVGGYTLNGSLAGLNNEGGPANNGLHGVIFEGANTAALGYVPFYNEQTGKFQILENAAAAGPLAELGAGGNPAGAAWYAIFEGTGE
jgi:hypothetical protein